MIMNFITENTEIISIIISIIIAACGFLYGRNQHNKSKAFKKGFASSETKSLNEKLDKLPCVINSDYVTNITNNVKTTESNNEILKEVSTWIMKLDNEMIEKLLKKCSPTKITSLGHVVFKETKAKEVYDNNIEFFVEELKKFDPQTPYDVEDKALSVMFLTRSDDMFNPIKEYLYYAPEIKTFTDTDTSEIEEVKLSMSTILKIMSLALRDEYLKRNPSIEQ